MNAGRVLMLCALCAATAQGGIDFSSPGCLRVDRGAWTDGAEQISFSDDGATVSFDAAKVWKAAPVYYSLSPRGVADETWSNRQVSVYVRFARPSPVLKSLSIEFHDADGEAFRYKPVKSAELPSGMTRLDYHIVEKGVCTETWGRRRNGRFDGRLRFAALLGSYRSPLARGRLTYVKLETSSIPVPNGDLAFDVDTGDPLHLIRGGQGDAALLFRNVAKGARRWRGSATCRDFFGGSFAVPVDVSVAAGETGRVPLGARTWRKGVWFVDAELEDGSGARFEASTRFAVLDRHEVTPYQPKPFFRMGINYHAQHYWADETVFARTLDALVACGAKLVRSGGFKFMDVAPKGEDDWTMTDRIYRELRARGFAINANVYPGPAWARKPLPDALEKTAHRTNYPTRDGLFRGFCERIAARYRGGIDYFEMGNEWDLTSKDILPEAEALRLLREGHSGIKAGDPGATVITCGWAGADSSDFSKAPNPGLLEAFAEKGQDAFDVWPLHVHGFFDNYAKALQERFFPLHDRVMPRKPWYSNETAMTTAGGNEDVAARAVWQKILYAWAWGSTDYIWYNLREIGPNSSERGFGLVTRDFHPRATYAAFSALTATLAGGTFEARLADTSAQRIYRFRGPDGKSCVLAGWSDGDGPVRLTIRSDATRAYAVDLMGNRTELGGESGTWIWEVSENPSALVLENGVTAEISHSPAGRTTLPCGQHYGIIHP